jgi:hypothetical protein
VKSSAISLLPLVLGLLFGQDTPQLVWQGDVQGIVTVFVKGKRLEIEAKDGAAVQSPHFRFNHALPDTTLDVRLDRIEGRGDVQIAEQPRADNSYTLAVRIEDRQSGSSHYSLAFHWDVSGERLEKPHAFSHGGRLTWKGRVDDEVVVSCHQSTCETKVTSGQPVLHESFKFSQPLPQSQVEVNLENSDGRGEIRLLEPPLEKNGYTARVLILDRENGPSDYSFTLAWSRPNLEQAPQPAPQLGLIWKGHVEGRVRVSIRGGAAFSEAIDGRRVTGEGTNFYRPLPNRSGLNASIRKLNGSGVVRIVEFPSAQNHFELVFEVDSHDTGGEDYQIEVDW